MPESDAAATSSDRRFPALHEMVAQGGVHAVLMLICWLAMMVLPAIYIADAMAVPFTRAMYALAVFGFFVAFCTFPAGVLWADLREDAEERAELLSAGDETTGSYLPPEVEEP